MKIKSSELPSGFKYPFHEIEITSMTKDECYHEFQDLITHSHDCSLIISPESKLFNELIKYCRKGSIPVALTTSGLVSKTSNAKMEPITVPYELKVTDVPLIGNLNGMAFQKGEKP